MYERLQADQNGRFWLGRNITGVLFEKSNDYFQTPEAFSRTVKVFTILRVLNRSILMGIVCVYDTLLCQSIGNAPIRRDFRQ